VWCVVACGATRTLQGYEVHPLVFARHFALASSTSVVAGSTRTPF
jgi:hypothetical protein